MRLNNSVLLLLLFSLCAHAKVAVDCTWPCPDTTHVCIVTNATVRCGPRHNSQWIIAQPNQSPVFIGETARRNTPCVTSPIPPLQEADDASDSQTLIYWPVGNSSHPLDNYLSDCEYNTFCSLESRICLQSRAEDDVCESTHQCKDTLQCIQNKCIDTRLDDDEGKEHSNNSNTIHTAIVVVVVIVAVLVILSVALFVYFYRRRKRLCSTKSSFSMQVVPPPPPPLPIGEEESTPTMQQQHLQYQLHRQHASDIKDNESTASNIPPPPYTP